MFRIITSKTLRYYERKAIEALDVPGLESRCASLQTDWEEAVAYIQVLEEQQRGADDQVTDLNRQLRELTTTFQDLIQQAGLPQPAVTDTDPAEARKTPEWAWLLYVGGNFTASDPSEEEARERAVRYGAQGTDFDTDPNSPYRIVRMSWDRFMTAPASEVVHLFHSHDATTS